MVPVYIFFMEKSLEWLITPSQSSYYIHLQPDPTIPAFSVSHSRSVFSCFTVFTGLSCLKSAPSQLVNNREVWLTHSYQKLWYRLLVPSTFPPFDYYLHVYLRKFCSFNISVPNWTESSGGDAYFCSPLGSSIHVKVTTMYVPDKSRWDTPKIDIWVNESKKGSPVLDLWCSRITQIFNFLLLQ